MEPLERVEPFRLTNQQFSLLPLQVSKPSLESQAILPILFLRRDQARRWVDVQIGDLNGDGKADIVGRDLANGSWWVGLSSGSSFSSSSWATWSSTVSRVDVRIGDFDREVKADTRARFGQRLVVGWTLHGIELQFQSVDNLEPRDELGRCSNGRNVMPSPPSP